MQQHCCDCRLTFIITEQRVAAQVTLRTGSRQIIGGGAASYVTSFSGVFQKAWH